MFGKNKINFKSIKSTINFACKIVILMLMNYLFVTLILKGGIFSLFILETSKYFRWIIFTCLFFSSSFLTILIILQTFYISWSANIALLFRKYKFKILIWIRYQQFKTNVLNCLLFFILEIVEFLQKCEINYQIIRAHNFNNFQKLNIPPPLIAELFS
ncbi:MAG: hypothetical protein C5T88_00580 [Williamsoniiplasma luminosum]|uniref:Transmembrane protein n=1 Tax=Williamsoniiplasma luminosum TaxID=214888 RepID=A0A2S0NJ98_9MOLU|nr:MAG: hypothetical protein C5T88_00580 [Williamsoniiplasma luminosum]